MTIRSGTKFVRAGKRLKKLRPKVRLSSKSYDTLEKRQKAIKKAGDYAGVILFSGGMDSVAVAIHLAKRKKKYLPVYLSHRANVGNVTKKEIVAARKLAKKILGEELMVFKKSAKSGKIPEWYGKKVRLTDQMPVPRQRKNTRNRKFLEVLKEAGLADKEIWLGVLGTGSDPSSRASSAGRAQDVSKQGLQKHLKKIGGKGKIFIVKDLPGVKTKVDLVKQIKDKKKELFQTQSCLMYFGRHCGDCWSCVDRAEAFMQALGEDKTPYRQSSKANRIVKGR